MAEAIITKFTKAVDAYKDGIKKTNDLTGEVKSLKKGGLTIIGKNGILKNSLKTLIIKEN